MNLDESLILHAVSYILSKDSLDRYHVTKKFHDLCGENSHIVTEVQHLESSEANAEYFHLIF